VLASLVRDGTHQRHDPRFRRNVRGDAAGRRAFQHRVGREEHDGAACTLQRREKRARGQVRGDEIDAELKVERGRVAGGKWTKRPEAASQIHERVEPIAVLFRDPTLQRGDVSRVRQVASIPGRGASRRDEVARACFRIRVGSRDHDDAVAALPERQGHRFSHLPPGADSGDQAEHSVLHME